MPDSLHIRAARIELLLLDVDGVLTDGSIVYGGEDVELKRFHVRDGSGLKLWQRAGKRAAIISGRNSRAVDRRAAELGVSPVLQGRADKLGRVLFNDPATGVMRHADAGYEIAKQSAHDNHLNLPMLA